MKKVLMGLALTSVLAVTGLMAQPKKGALTADDYMEIQQLYARYNWAIDSGEAEAWAGMFTADGVFQTFKGRDALVGFIHTWVDRMKGGSMRHWNSNLAITPTAEGANGAVYLLIVDVSAKPPAIASASKYTDQLVKTPDGWRFKSRQVKGDAPNPAPTAAPK